MKLKQFLLIKHLKTHLVISGLFIITVYIIAFIYSKPTVDTDYLAQLNKINMPENYKPEDNAWPYYQKAFDLYTEPDFANSYSIIFESIHKDFSDFNDIEQRNINDWIEQNQPAWEEFTKASLKPYFYFKYEIQELDETSPFSSLLAGIDLPALMKIGFPQLSTLREIAFLCKWRVYVLGGSKYPKSCRRQFHSSKGCFSFS